MKKLNQQINFKKITSDDKVIKIQVSKKLANEFNNTHNDLDKIVFEGTLVPIGWDNSDCVSLTSLYTNENENIPLVHKREMDKIRPYLNQKVRIWGEIIISNRNEKSLLVKKITCILDGIRRPIIEAFDKLGRVITTHSD